VIKSAKTQIRDVIRMLDGIKNKLKKILDLLEKIAPELD
jgi:hypothetical protein